jgi:hypothetical protein
VLVPQPFMDWANKKFGTGTTISLRVLLFKQITHPGTALADYLSKHSLSTTTEKTRFEKYRAIINAVVGNIMGYRWVNAVICIDWYLPCLYSLPLHQAKEEIALLITLGAAPKQLQKFLRKQFLPANIITVMIALIIVLQCN